jgi:hypothetical protein
MPLTDLKINLGTAPETAPEFDRPTEPEFSGFTPDPFPTDYGEAADYPIAPPPPKRGAPRPAAVPTITKAMEKEVREEIQALLTMASLMWSIPDPECAGVLHEQSRQIAESLTALLRRNPRLLASLRAAGWMGDWVQLAMAVGPVASAIYRHHMVPKPEEETDYDGDPTAPRVADFPAYIPRGTGNATVA